MIDSIIKPVWIVSLCLSRVGWELIGLYGIVWDCVGAISYCEIGTLIPQSGGEYAYFLEAFGPLHSFFGPIAAFLYAWVNILLLKPCTLAILSLSFAKYLLSPILLATGFCMENEYLYYVLTRICAAICIGKPCHWLFQCYSITMWFMEIFNDCLLP